MTEGAPRVERDGDVVRITMTRPAKRNALSREHLTQLLAAVTEAGGTDAEVLVPGVTRLLGAYRQALLSAQGMTGELPELPTDPIVLSYLIAAAMVLDMSDKQRLLSAPDAATRLGLELILLRHEASILSQLPSMPAVELTRVGYSRN